MITQLVVHYPYFRKNYKLIAIDSWKQEALDADIKTTPQINSHDYHREAANLYKTFAKNFAINIELSKKHLFKIIQSCEFLVKLLQTLLKIDLLLAKDALAPLAKSVLIPLRLKAAATTDFGIQKKPRIWIS